MKKDAQRTPAELSCALTREQAEAIYAQGPEVVIDLLMEFTARVAELERRLGMNSRNSSRPPSSDPPSVRRPNKKPTGRKRGGQPGHESHWRKLLPLEEVDQVIALKPSTCKHCNRRIDGEDPSPRRHQVWDLPVIRPEVREYQLHRLQCEHCGEYTPAQLPQGFPSGAFGPRAQGAVAICTGVYHMSKRTVEGMMEDIFHMPISLGSICSCESMVSAALAEPVEESHRYVQEQQVLHADETGWREANSRAWLWVAVTALVTVFEVHAHRGQKAARELLGRFAGALISDRWSAYNVYKGLRQFCWSHLKWDFTAFSEFGQKAGEIGERLLERTKQMFQWWHRVRDGTLPRRTFQRYMEPLRADVEGLLHQGTACGHKKMERSCKRILKQASALWTFVDVEGVEPTNNAAERAVRPGVLWRKGSFGTQSAEGSRFAERIMSAAATCKQQGRSIVEYITDACHAYLHGHDPPSLLPQSPQPLPTTP